MLDRYLEDPFERSPTKCMACGDYGYVDVGNLVSLRYPCTCEAGKIYRDAENQDYLIYDICLTLDG